MSVAQYIRELNRLYAGGNATEHTYRTALTALLQAELDGASVVNEPKQIECGAPDLLVQRNGIAFGYVETKNIGVNLDDASHRAQIKRYSEALDNLIFTDYLIFRLIREGAAVAEVCIGELRGGKIKPLPQNFDAFVDLLKSFSDYQGCTISTADELANRMAHKARMLASVIEKAIDKKGNGNGEDLTGQWAVFRKHLIHDLEPAQFADIYAQTVAYGMFAARLHDATAQPFTRKKAAELIPPSNPFLRKFFQHIAGYDLDDRIVWVVDDLADLFCAADVDELMKGYGKQTERTDPFLHFYETFLGAYDPAKRKSRGVYYTPEPVVDFIVRAVDELLCDKFKLHEGIADYGKITVTEKDQPREIHKVQILDPATGTGTFLAAIVKRIKQKYYANQKGAWQGYVNEHLIPRLNGFELLMAAYAMAHVKLDMVLRESGCDVGKERLRVFLTNSLEEQHADTQTLFARWLSDEAKEANAIKRETPVMVVIGNPPYAVGSSNKGKWIKNLIADYKKGLNERRENLDDDYVKFIRYGEHLVERNDEGILAYISNNSFLSGVTHRQMRKHLLETFDEIYIVDLHGNSRIQETAPDGSKDENVFDIQQGVSINLFVKTGNKAEGALAQVFHCDCYGLRKGKYEFLNQHNLAKVKFAKLKRQEPYYFFVPKDFSEKDEYEKGFKTTELFVEYSSGVKTKADHIAVDFDKRLLQKRVSNILDNKLTHDQIREKYGLDDKTTWEYSPNGGLAFEANKIADYEYRPFDIRKVYYDKRFLSRARDKVMDNFFNKQNLGLEVSRNEHHVFIGRFVSDEHYASGNSFKLPLYIYPEPIPNTLEDRALRDPNLNMGIVNTIADSLGLRFVIEKQQDDKQQDAKTFAPIDLLDYIYAVLHSPAYREKYIEFLKIDFPRVPYPTDKTQFRKLAKLGEQLRELHLLQSNKPLITAYNQKGDNIVGKIKWETTDPVKQLGKVHINAQQCFDKVPATAWDFYIGGYQPAQKWLKDRKDIALTADDIRHWQKIIVALVETARLMKAVDGV